MMGETSMKPIVVAFALVVAAACGVSRGQSDAEAAAKADAALNAPADSRPAAVDSAVVQARSLLQLFLAGGPLMWPILAMSFLVVAFTVERLIALRRSRIVPRRFVEQLDRLSRRGALELQQLKQLCEDEPSVTSTVVRALIDRLGRPLGEVERAVADAKDREASRLYSNIRPISLAASVTPLIGLLGTVQGMILAFYTTANLKAGADRASELAGGIYIALITTFAGLCVAIPAAVIAHWLEGKILSGFRRVDDVVARFWRLAERCENLPRSPQQAASPSHPRQPSAKS